MILIYPDGYGTIIPTLLIRSIEKADSPEKKSIFHRRPLILPLYNNKHYLKVTTIRDQIYCGYSPLFDDVISISSDLTTTGTHADIVTKIEQTEPEYIP